MQKEFYYMGPSLPLVWTIMNNAYVLPAVPLKIDLMGKGEHEYFNGLVDEPSNCQWKLKREKG
jgi:hypothetical protein